MRFPSLAAAAALFILIAPPLSAGEAGWAQKPLSPGERKPAAPASVFQKGAMQLSVMAHSYWSFSLDGELPNLDYAQGSIRFGRMLSDPRGDGIWRHNTELIVEALYADVTHGSGDWIAGGNVLIRRNFIGQDERVAWYLQAGGGLVANDIYLDLSQTLIGRATEFSLMAGAGVRFQLGKNWHGFIEVDVRHLSNADTRDRNTGLNSLGGGVGIGRSF